MSAGLASLFLLIGCTDADAPGPQPPIDPDTSPITITFLRHDNPNYVTADRAFFADYTATHPHVTIQDETVNFMTLAARLNGDLKRDQFPYDLVLIPPGWVCGYAANLSDVPSEVISLTEAENTFYKAPLEGATCAGKLKGLPVEYNLEYGGVVVNLDKYAAKFPGKTPGWASWDSFIDEVAMLGEYDAAGKPMANGLDLSPDWPPPVIALLLSGILQRNGSYWNAGGDLFDLDTPVARASLAAMVGWVRDKKIMHRSLVPDMNTSVEARLAAGAQGYGWSDPARPLSITGYMGTWGVPSATASLPPGSNWRYEFFVVPPMVGGEHRFVSHSGWAFAVPLSSSPRKRAVAWDVAKSLTLSANAMRKWSGVTGALPALRANGTVSAAEGNPTLAKVSPLFDKGQWVGYIPSGALPSVSFAILNNFFDAAEGRKTVEAALADMQMTANAAIVANR